MEEKLTIAIDFDGTIVEHKYPEIGELKEYAIETMRALKDEGHRIIIWSCRGGRDEQCVIDFLNEHDIPYDTINDHTEYDMKLRPGLETTRKIFADVYIDDKSLFPANNWELIAKALGVWKRMVCNLIQIESL